MTDDFKNDALRYLLGELDAEARAAFEARLAADADARDELKRVADSVARFACETAPAEALPPAVQRGVLREVFARIEQEPPRRAPRRRPSLRLLLPLAAAVVLGFWLARLVPAGPHRSSEQSFAAGPGVSRDGTDAGIAQAKPEDSAKTAEVPGSRSATPGSSQQLAEEAKLLEKLRLEHAALGRAHEDLKTRFAIMQRQLAVIDSHGGRLTAIELVDSESHARGERKGLVDLARGLLTEPGIVALSPVVPNTPATPAQPPPTPETPQKNPDDVGATIIETTPNPAPPPAEPTPNPVVPDPYAWSVYDESAQRGYLNLYHLPATQADQTLQLWVKQPGSDSYLNVGTIPAQYYGGSGSVYYSLPGSTQAPSEILITREPKNTPVTKPGGNVVLRGP